MYNCTLCVKALPTSSSLKLPDTFSLFPMGPQGCSTNTLTPMWLPSGALSLSFPSSPSFLASSEPGWSLFHPIILRAFGKYIITHLQLSLASYTQQLLWSNQSQLAAERLAGTNNNQQNLFTRDRNFCHKVHQAFSFLNLIIHVNFFQFGTVLSRIFLNAIFKCADLWDFRNQSQ
jgi:hypothetical protein